MQYFEILRALTTRIRIYDLIHICQNRSNIIQLLPLSEGDMVICSPEAGNIALTQGQQLFYYTEPFFETN